MKNVYSLSLLFVIYLFTGVVGSFILDAFVWAFLYMFAIYCDIHYASMYGAIRLFIDDMRVVINRK